MDATLLAKLWDFDDPAGSEHRFRDAAASAAEPDRSVLLTQLARALGLQDRFDEGHAVLDEVAAEVQAADDAGAVDAVEVRARIALERGRLLRSAGQPEASDPWFRDAAARTAQWLDRPPLGGLHVDALHMLAMLPDDPQARVQLLDEALAVASASTDPSAHRWRGSLLNNLGMAQHDAGHLDASLATFREALAVREEAGDRRGAQIARWTIGWTLRLLGRLDDARTLQLALRDDLVADGISDQYVAQELALIHAATDA